jgi:hypothetical protein
MVTRSLLGSSAYKADVAIGVHRRQYFIKVIIIIIIIIIITTRVALGVGVFWYSVCCQIFDIYDTGSSDGLFSHRK